MRETKTIPLQFHRMHRRLFRTVWSVMASFALLIMTLAPSVSEALENARGESQFEICSMGGVMQLADGKSGHPGGRHHFLEHCPYCALHGHALAPPPTPVAASAEVKLPRELPVLFLQAARTAHPWVSAQPRAPPAA